MTASAVGVEASLTPLILCPGLVCDAAVWAHQVAALSTHRRCHVMPWGLHDSLTAMAQQVLQEAAAQRFALAGHSMGGRVALEVMRLAPERVERLALLDTGVHPLAIGAAGDKEREGRMALVGLAQTQGMRAMGQVWAQPMVHPKHRDSALFEDILLMLGRSSAAQFFAQQTALLNRPDASATLRAVTCPLLMLCGEQDGWSPPAQHRAMQALAPHAVLQVLPDCGHMAPMEAADAVTQALQSWLVA